MTLKMTLILRKKHRSSCKILDIPLLRVGWFNDNGKNESRHYVKAQKTRQGSLHLHDNCSSTNMNHRQPPEWIFMYAHGRHPQCHWKNMLGFKCSTVIYKSLKRKKKKKILSWWDMDPVFLCVSSWCKIVLFCRKKLGDKK